MSATPVWFGPPDQPLFGWLHLPDGGLARGGVVLCEPVGYEYVCAHAAFRLLAARLAQAGFAVLRFDYDGTGDSAHDHTDSDRVGSWRRSIDCAVELVRDAGAPAVAAVGMRLGATLLAQSVADGIALDGLVLWDPVWSGASFARYLRAVQLLGVGDSGKSEQRDDGSVDAAGVVWSAATLADLRATTMPSLARVALPLLVLHRPDLAPAPDDLARMGPAATWVPIPGQPELLERESSVSLTPEDGIAQVAAWLDKILPDEPVPVATPALPVSVAVGGGVRERAVRFAGLGLFGIISEGAPVAGRPALVLVNNATDHHIGPSRLWVDWGREMAQRGFRVARVDLSGIGDSPPRPGYPPDRPYPGGNAEDLGEIAEALDDGSGVYIVGLCSGGRNALDGALAIRARGVCAINADAYGDREALEQVRRNEPTPEGLRTYLGNHRIRHVLALLVPSPVWKALDRANVVPSKARLLQRLVDSGVDTLLVCAEDEFPLYKLRETSAWTLRRLSRRPGFRLVELADVDHALMRRQGRDQATRVLTDHLLSLYGDSPAEQLGSAQLVGGAAKEPPRPPDPPSPTVGGDDAEAGTVRQGMTFAGASFTTSVLLALGSSVLTSRIYGIRVIGEYALASAPWIMILGLSTLREQVQFVRLVSRLQPRHPRVSGLFAVVLGFSAALTLLVSLIGMAIAAFLLDGPLHHPGLVVPAAVILGGYTLLDNTNWNLDMVFSAFRRGQSMFLARTIQAATFLALGVGLALTTHTVWALTLATVGSFFVGICVRLFLVRTLMTLRPPKGEIRAALPELPGILRFGMRLVPGTLVGSITSQMDVWVLSAVAGVAQVGAYSRASGLASKLSEASWRISEILFPTLVRHHDRRQPAEFADLLDRTVRLSAAAVFLPVACADGVARPVLQVFGPGFDQATTAMVVLFLGYGCWVISDIISQPIIAIGLPGTLTATTIVSSLVTGATMYPFAERWGATGVGVSLLIGWALQLIVRDRITRTRVLEEGTTITTGHTLMATAAAWAAGFAAARIAADALPGFAGLVVGLVVGVIAYTAAGALCGLVTRDELRAVREAIRRQQTVAAAAADEVDSGPSTR